MTVARDEHGAAHIVGLSFGKDSVCMALALQEMEPRPYTFVCTPTGDELPDWHEHMRSVAAMVGELQIVTSGVSLNGLVEREKMIPNSRARFCTRVLKIEPYRKWLAANSPVTSSL